MTEVNGRKSDSRFFFGPPSPVVRSSISDAPLEMPLNIFHAGPVSENLRRLRRLAEHLGIPVEMTDVNTDQSLAAAIREAIEQSSQGLILDLQSLTGRQGELAEVTEILSVRSLTVLLFVSASGDSANQLLQTFSGGRVERVVCKDSAASIEFPISGRALNGELSSHTYAREAKEALTLTLTEGEGVCSLMELTGIPAFVFFALEAARIFVWSTPEVFDIDRPLTVETEFELACDEYIPAIIFLRAAFGDRCWHNPAAGAGIVIDDPLLKKKYGFIDFAKLLKSARLHAYHVTLAFIPWNQWRSRVQEVKLFLDYSDCFSICVHGCDHTRNEYGLADYDGLLRKNFVAKERMARHSRRTGLESEPFIVCPQEKYSLEAMQAFSDSRVFLGLACTACMPRNQASPKVSGADLLLPAQDCLFGFAVFKRHYWRDMSVFAMALFLGKPAILVEHHDFFRHGPAGVEEFVRRLAELRPDLEWRSLGETMARTHVRRLVSPGRYAIRFFTDRFILEHEIEGPTEYFLSRRVPRAAVVERVLVRNEATPFTQDKDFVRFKTHADKPEKMIVQVEVAPVKPSGRYPDGIKYQTSVILRRGLSELRDNVVSRNRFALKAGRFMVKSLERMVASKR